MSFIPTSEEETIAEDGLFDGMVVEVEGQRGGKKVNYKATIVQNGEQVEVDKSFTTSDQILLKIAPDYDTEDRKFVWLTAVSEPRRGLPLVEYGLKFAELHPDFDRYKDRLRTKDIIKLGTVLHQMLAGSKWRWEPTRFPDWMKKQKRTHYPLPVKYLGGYKERQPDGAPAEAPPAGLAAIRNGPTQQTAAHEAETPGPGDVTAVPPAVEPPDGPTAPHMDCDPMVLGALLDHAKERAATRSELLNALRQKGTSTGEARRAFDTATGRGLLRADAEGRYAYHKPAG